MLTSLNPRSTRHLPVMLLVLLVVGCGGGNETPSAEAAAVPPRDDAPAAESAAAEDEPGLLPLPRPVEPNGVGVRLHEYEIDLTSDTVSAGTVRFHVLNSGRTSHMLIVRNEDEYSATQHIEPRDSAVLEVTLSPGEYRVLCDVRDEYSHLSEGMLRTLVVR